MKTPVRFSVGDVELAGDFYTPAGSGKFPALLMSQGFGAVKDMCLQPTAEIFAAAGFAVLVYEHRNYGDSGGEPRREIDPWQQIRDMREAISYLRSRPKVDPERIGLWGTSYSGGHAIIVSSIDRRVKCVVAQVPLVSGSLNFKRTIPSGDAGAFLADLSADYDARARGEPPKYVPISKEGSEGRRWSSQFEKGTSYQNSVTLRSVGNMTAYEPGDYVHRVSPTPLLFVLAKNDNRCPIDDQLETYQRAREPKKLVLLEGGHYDPYMSQLENAANAAREWFTQHLKPAGK